MASIINISYFILLARIYNEMRLMIKINPSRAGPCPVILGIFNKIGIKIPPLF